MNRVKVAAIQLGADATKPENLEKALRMIDEAVDRHGPLDVVVLPEYCCGEPTTKKVAEFAERLQASLGASRMVVDLVGCPIAVRGARRAAP